MNRADRLSYTALRTLRGKLGTVFTMFNNTARYAAINTHLSVGVTMHALYVQKQLTQPVPCIHDFLDLKHLAVNVMYGGLVCVIINADSDL